MALTPEDIESQTFKIARRGYDKVEVDRFLGSVATSYRDVLKKAERVPEPYQPATLLTPAAPLPKRDVAEAAAAEAQPAIAPAVEDDAPAQTGDDFGRLGSEVAAVLRTAHHSVATLREEAEGDAIVIRHRAEGEAVVIRNDADQYAAQTKAEADVYATERKREADVERREAERALAEARLQAEAQLTDAEQRIANITERAEAVARARSAEVVADANRRVEQANATEQALRERLLAAHGDLGAAVNRLPTEPGPKLVITDDAVGNGTPVVDLTTGEGEGEHAAAEPDALVLSDGSTEEETFAPMGHPGGWDEPVPDHDPLADKVKDAVGKAVQSAMNRRDQNPT